MSNRPAPSSVVSAPVAGSRLRREIPSRRWSPPAWTRYSCRDETGSVNASALSRRTRVFVQQPGTGLVDVEAHAEAGVFHTSMKPSIDDRVGQALQESPHQSGCAGSSRRRSSPAARR